MIHQERRVKTFNVGYSTVMDWFASAVEGWKRSYVQLPMLTGLPDGTEVLSVYMDWQTRMFSFHLYHESFEPVEEGMPPPRLNTDLTWNVVRIKTETE